MQHNISLPKSNDFFVKHHLMIMTILSAVVAAKANGWNPFEDPSKLALTFSYWFITLEIKVEGCVVRYVDMKAEVTKHICAKNVPYLSILFVPLVDLRRPDSFKFTIFGMLPRLAISLEDSFSLPRSMILLDVLLSFRAWCCSMLPRSVVLIASSVVSSSLFSIQILARSY